MMNENEESSIDKVIDNIFYISLSVTKRLRHSFRKKTNLNPVSYYVLRLLCRYEMLSMSEIGNKLLMPKPHVTAQIDKLIAENMVERLFDPNDRRIINVKLTEKGKEDLKLISQEVSQEMRQLILTLDPQKRETMLNSSQQLRNILSEIMKDSHSETASCHNH
jgi:DNA-binding MarR family transcriptional regulator